MANAITKKYTHENQDQKKSKRKKYVYIGLITSIVAFTIRLTLLGFIANPEKHGDGKNLIFFFLQTHT